MRVRRSQTTIGGVLVAAIIIGPGRAAAGHPHDDHRDECLCSRATITSPAEGAVFDEVPEFRVAFRNKPPRNLVFAVNGEDLTDLFTVDASGAWAPGDSIRAFLREGDNRFRVESGVPGCSVGFVFDTLGPSVRVTSVGEGDPLQVAGRLEDRAGAVSLSINGQDVPLQGDRFEASVAETPFIRFEAADALGHLSDVRFARPGTVLEAVTLAGVHEGGIAVLGSEIESHLAAIDYGGRLLSLPRLFDEGDWFASARVDGTDMALLPPEVILWPSSGQVASLDIEVEFSGFQVFLEGEGTILGIPWWGVGQASAVRAVFEARALIGVEGESLTVDLDNASASLDGFEVQIDNFPYELEGLFFDVLKDLLENFVLEILVDELPSLVEDFLGDIPSESAFDLGNASFLFDALPGVLQTTADGLAVSLGGGMQTTTPADVAPAIGSLFVPNVPPQLPTPGGTTHDVSVAVGVNLLDQALLAAYRAGLTHVVLDDVFPRMRCEVLPSSPPFIRFADTGVATLGLDEFVFGLEFLPVGESEWRPVFAAVLDMEAPLAVGVNGDELEIEVAGVPTTRVYSVDDAGIIQLDPDFVQAVLDRVLPLAMPKLTALLGEIRIPGFGGHSIQVQDVSVGGEPTAYWVLAGDLVEPDQLLR